MAEPYRDPKVDHVAEAWARLWWALKPWHWFKPTPYTSGGDQDPEQRWGIGDISHAITNVPVEAARQKPKRIGKWFLASLALNVALLVGILAAFGVD